VGLATSSTVQHCSCTGAQGLLAHLNFKFAKAEYEQPFAELKIFCCDVVSCSLVEVF
jgi:hypothetical protein